MLSLYFDSYFTYILARLVFAGYPTATSYTMSAELRGHGPKLMSYATESINRLVSFFAVGKFYDSEQILPSEMLLFFGSNVQSDFNRFIDGVDDFERRDDRTLILGIKSTYTTLEMTRKCIVKSSTCHELVCICYYQIITTF